MEFDWNGPATEDSGIFGLPWSAEASSLVLLPVPWAATVSYGSGAELGPEAILKASKQVDLYSEWLPEVWKYKTAMLPSPSGLMESNSATRKRVEQLLNALWEGQNKPSNAAETAQINQACKAMNEAVKAACLNQLNQGKRLGLVGGDHSTPLGYYQALGEHHGSFSILQIDAHADLRKAYEGFIYSHASIMYNALEQVAGIEALVQVGIRDLCEEEADLAKKHGKVHLHTDAQMQAHVLEGKGFETWVAALLQSLGKEVYISVDIDGLDPSLCPSTGTPVPGGLTFYQACRLVHMVVESGRKVIGFDLVEVVPGPTEWDANVGARMLFQLCAAVHAS
jgi:agmatinase